MSSELPLELPLEESNIEGSPKDIQEAKLEVLSDSREHIEFKLESGNPLTEKDLERFKLIRLAQSGDKKAMDEVVRSNMGLVRRAASYHARSNRLEFDVLVNEGCKAMIRAAQKFNFSYKFSTYANHWINNVMKRAILEQGPTIKVPNWQQQNLGRIKKAKNKREQELGRSLTSEEFNEQLQEAGHSKKQIGVIISADSIRMSSYDSSPTDEEQRGYEEVLYADTPSPEEQLISESNRKKLRKVIRGMKGNSRLVLEWRLFKDLTLEKIGGYLGLTRERIRQIEEKALEEVREAFLKQVEQEKE